MLADRRLLNFDATLSPVFFTIAEGREFVPDLGLATPKSAEELTGFLRSPQGEALKKVLAAHKKALEAWCGANGVNPEKCKSLKKYIDYSGNSEEMNRTYIGVYKEAIPFLAEIIRMLNENKIPLAIRQDKIIFMLENIDVCGPGAHTQIYNTYLEMRAFTEVPLEWMAIRKKLAEQIVMEKLAKYGVRDTYVVHYVNAVLNRYAADVAIKVIMDANIRYAQPDIVESLCLEFEPEIQRLLTMETVIEEVLAGPGLTQIDILDRLRKSETDVHALNDLVEDFQRNLDRYGSDACKFFSMHDLLEVDENIVPLKPHRLKWDLNYTLFASLFQRMLQRGYLAVVVHSQVMVKLPKGDAVIHYMPGHSLKLAYVKCREPGTETVVHKSFIPYCIENIINQPENFTYLLGIIRAGHLREEQLREIIAGCFKFLSHSMAGNTVAVFRGLTMLIAAAGVQKFLAGEMAKEPVKQPLLAQVSHELPLAAILSVMPRAKYAALFRFITADKLKLIFKDHHAYVNLLCMLEPDNYAEFFNALGREAWLPAINSLDAVAAVFTVVPMANHARLLQAIGAVLFEQVIKTHEDFAALLQRLRGGEYISLVASLGNAGFMKYFGSPQKLACYFSALPIEKYPDFIHAIELEKMLEMIAGRSASSEGIAALLSAMPVEKYPALLACVEGSGSMRFCGNLDQVTVVMSALPIEKRAAFLQAAGQYVNWEFLNIDLQPLYINQLRPEDYAGFIILVAADMWPIVVPDLQTLINLLTSVPPAAYSAYLGAIGNAHLKTLLASPDAVVCVVNALSKDADKHRANEFLKVIAASKNAMSAAIQDAASCALVLKAVGTDLYVPLISALENDLAWSLIKNLDNLLCILRSLNADQRASFFSSMNSDAWAVAVPNESSAAFTAVACAISSENYPALIACLKQEKQDEFFGNPETFAAIIAAIIPANRHAFMRRLPGNRIAGLVTDAARLTTYLQAMSSDQYTDFVRFFSADALAKLIIQGAKNPFSTALALPAAKRTKFILSLPRTAFQYIAEHDPEVFAQLVCLTPGDHLRELPLEQTRHDIQWRWMVHPQVFQCVVKRLAVNNPDNIPVVLQMAAPAVLQVNKDANILEYLSVIPEQHRFLFLSSLGAPILNQYFQARAGAATAIFTHRHDILLNVLSCLPEDKRMGFINLIDMNVCRKFIPDLTALKRYTEMLPLDDRIVWLKNVGAEIVIRLVSDLQKLTAILGSLPYYPDPGQDKYVAHAQFFEMIGANVLCQIFNMKEKKHTREAVESLVRYDNRDNTHLFYALLIAVKRAYHKLRNDSPDEYDHFWGSLFSGQDKNTRLIDANELEKAIRLHDYEGFFGRLERDGDKKKAVLERGDLHYIVMAFKAHHEKHVLTQRQTRSHNA